VILPDLDDLGGADDLRSIESLSVRLAAIARDPAPVAAVAARGQDRTGGMSCHSLTQQHDQIDFVWSLRMNAYPPGPSRASLAVKALQDLLSIREAR
jgi:hypothetical protein